MKISFWKEAVEFPKNKNDKISLAKKVSGSDNLPLIEYVDDLDKLLSVITTFCWSPFVFSGNRSSDNFLSCDFIVLDIDNGLSIKESEIRVAGMGISCVCLPSPSFSQENQKHRLIFPLLRTIYNVEVLYSTLDYMLNIFPEADAQCVDAARWFCMSTMDDGFFQDGKLLSPIYPTPKKEVDVRLKNEKFQVDVSDGIKGLVRSLYGKDRERVPEAVSFFLENAHSGLSGLWINSLNSCCFSLGLSGIEEDVIIEVLETIAPSPLDKKDLYQIHRAVRDGRKNRENPDL